MAHALRPEDISFVDRAPLLVRQQVEVPAPPQEVWPAFAEAGAWAEWFAAVESVQWTSPGAPGVGSTRRVTLKGLEVEERLLAFDEAERFSFTVLEASRRGFGAMVEVMTLEPTAGGTLVTYRQAVELAGIARLFAPLVKRQLSSELATGLAGLPGWVANHRVA